MTTDLLYSEDDASFTYHDHADDDDDESDFMDDENIAPNVKRGVGKSSSKKSSNGSSKSSSSGGSSGKVKKLSISESNPKGKKKTVEEMYQKKTQLEHILLRPDTYGTLSWLYIYIHIHICNNVCQTYTVFTDNVSTYL